MDFDDLPIGERLDALLRQFDEGNNEPEGDLDYAQFVERRAQEQEREHDTDDGFDKTRPDGAFESDREQNWFSGNESDEDPLLSPLSSPGASQSLVKETVSLKRTKKPRKAKHRQTQASKPSLPPSPKSRSVTGGVSDTKIERSNANISQRQVPRRAAKQSLRELEDAARQDQRLERMLAGEIQCHTVKSATVDEFLADFDAQRSPSSPPRPRQADKRFSELVSSPPKMQGLRSFIAHGDSHSGPGLHSDADSDSDLEIVPETRAARMPQPIRELLRLGGGTSADRQIAATRAKLQQLERDQIVKRSKARIEKLKLQGFDVEELAQAMNQQRQASAQGAEAWLAHEREEADALRAAERSDEGEGESSSSDFEVEDPPHSEPELVSETLQEARKGRRMMLSDSEDESAEDEHLLASEPPGPNDEADTDEDEGAQLGGGTQYVAPLSPRSRAALFGSQMKSSPASESTPEPLPEAPEPLPETLPDTLPDTIPDALPKTPMSSDLEIEVGCEADEEARIEPDLSDLRHANLSLSQRMAEVRQRYLRAENEQRRRHVQQGNPTTSDTAKRRMRSAFVEDQAEESDDEEGTGGIRRHEELSERDEEDGDEADIDLAGLVDHKAVDVKAEKLKQKFAEEERKRDERLLNHFVDGVNGGFRRRQTRDKNGLFLSDDDVELDNNEELRAYRQLLEQKRQSKLLGSNSRMARLAASERSQAFFQSITTELIARPNGAERSSTVKDGLQFLRKVDSGRRKSLVGAPMAAPSLTDHEGDHNEAEPLPASGLSKALKVASLRPPRKARRKSTIQDPQAGGLEGRRATYASRISATEQRSGKTVEIMQSLGPKQAQQQTKKLVPPRMPQAQKRRHMVSATARESGSVMFRRNWA